MNKNINEQVSRIKQMMGLNEERVDLNDYKDESSIVEDIKRVGTTSDGAPITSMKLNAYVPTKKSQTEGVKVKFEVILEWQVDTSTKYKNRYRLKKVSGIVADRGLNSDALMLHLGTMLAGNPTPHDMMMEIYRPFLNQYRDNEEYREKILNNIDKDRDVLLGVLSGKMSPEAEPNMNNEPPQEKPSKGNDMWTSTSSW